MRTRSTFHPFLLLSGILLLAASAVAPAQDLAGDGEEPNLYHGSDRWQTQSAYDERDPLPSPDDGRDLSTYIRFGLENNPGLRASHDLWRSAIEAVPQAKALPDPKFSFNYLVEPIQTRTGPQRTQFFLSQTFSWFGKLRLRGDAASKRVEKMWWQVQAKRLAVVREIKQAYYEYTHLGQVINIAEDSLNLLREAEPIAQRLVQGGGNQTDLLQLQIEIGKMEDELRSLHQLRPVLSSRLSAVLSHKSEEILLWPKALEARFIELSPDVLSARLEEANPELRTLQVQVALEATRERLARLDGRPDFSLGFLYLETGQSTMPIADSGKDPFGVTFSMSLPLWRGKYESAREEAEAEHRAARASLLELENELHATLQLLLFQLDAAARRVRLYGDAILPRARQTLEITITSYLSGKTTVLEVIDNSRALLDFEKTHLGAIRDYEQRLADLEALCGGEIQ